MTMRNLKITCRLSSPLCGDAPKIDAIMEYELAMKIGMKHSRKLTRDIPLSEIQRPPIPVARRTIAGYDMYCASDPILHTVSADYTERQSKRFDTDVCAELLDEKHRKKLNTSSGPYKARYVPIRVRNVDAIAWFVRGDKGRINQLLRNIRAVGAERSYGYGAVASWEYEEIEDDNSIFSDNAGQRVIMRTMPAICAEGATGYKQSYGGAFPPYWHPDTFMEVAIPC